MICICAREDDQHAVKVAEILKSRHGEETFVFDTAQFPESVSLSATFRDGRGEFSLATSTNPHVPLLEIRSVWWRRPQPMLLDPRITDGAVRNFTFQECVSALYGVLGCCDALWVNDLKNDTAAEYKPYQLKVAGELGFRIPATLITNDPARITEFWEQESGSVVYKAFNQRGLAWRPTRLLTKEDFELMPHVRHAPVIFQAYIPGARDIRATVIGDSIFAAEFDIERLDSADHRMRMSDLPCRSHQLSADVEKRARAMMDRLGLEYGALDFRLTPEGEYVFFEVNTAGEFLYIEERTGQPIADQLAAHLARGERSHPHAGHGPR